MPADRTAGHHRPHPRAVDDAAQLGALGALLRGQGLPRPRPRPTPASRSRSRRCARTRPPIATLTVPADRRAPRPAIVGGLERPPIIMGHSFGGTLTQLLLARGLGAAGVVIDSAPTEGVRVTPLSQIRSFFPILNNPPTPTGPSASRRAVPLRVHQHAERGGVGRGLRALPHPRARDGSCGPTACSPTGSRATRRPGSTSATTIARRCCSSPVARTTSCRRR